MLTRGSDTISKRKSGKARIEAPMREARNSPTAHRGARVIRTDALCFVLILREPRDGQECKQDSEDDPDINAHQSSGSYPPIHRSKRKPRAQVPGLGEEPSKRTFMRMAGFIARYLLKSGSTIFVPFGFKRPDPPLSNRRVGTCHNAGCWPRHGQYNPNQKTQAGLS